MGGTLLLSRSQVTVDHSRKQNKHRIYIFAPYKTFFLPTNITTTIQSYPIPPLISETQYSKRKQKRTEAETTRLDTDPPTLLTSIQSDLVGAVECAPLDVGVGDRGVGNLVFDVGGDTGGDGTLTALDTGVGRGLVKGVGAVEPEHVRRMVVPDRQSENHTLTESISELLESTLPGEVVVIAESSLCSSAEGIGDGVSGDASDVRVRVGEDYTVLLVFPADLNEVAVCGTVPGDELGDDGELCVGVDGLSLSVERDVTHAVAVEIATVLVADTSIAVGAISALGARAAGQARGSARMRGIGGGHVVCFPDIHLVAASSIAPGTGIDVGARRGPIEYVGLGSVSIVVSNICGIEREGKTRE